MVKLHYQASLPTPRRASAGGRLRSVRPVMDPDPVAEIQTSRAVIGGMLDRTRAWLSAVSITRVPAPRPPVVRPALATAADRALVIGHQLPSETRAGDTEIDRLIREVAIVLGCDEDYAQRALGWLLVQWLDHQRHAWVNWNSRQVVMFGERLVFQFRPTVLGGSRRDGSVLRLVARYRCPDCEQPLDMIEPADLETIEAAISGHHGGPCQAWTATTVAP